MPVDSSGVTCVLDAGGNLRTSSSTDACFGGSARRKQYIGEYKINHTNTIVLDGGSAFWGSFMCTKTSASSSQFFIWMSEIFVHGCMPSIYCE